MSSSDLLGALIGAPDGSVIDQLRSQRPEIKAHSQGYHDVLLSPADPGGLSLAERACIAWRVALLTRHAGLTTHYRALADARGEPGARQAVLDAHVTRVTQTPRAAEPAHIDALRAQGLAPRDIVALTQIVAFVSYQARAAFGLRLLVEEPAL
jgi:uncharacterized protein YciW